jgi:hypothetical protein
VPLGKFTKPVVKFVGANWIWACAPRMRRTVTKKSVEQNLDISMMEDLTAGWKCNRDGDSKKRNFRRASTTEEKMKKRKLERER